MDASESSDEGCAAAAAAAAATTAAAFFAPWRRSGPSVGEFVREDELDAGWRSTSI